MEEILRRLSTLWDGGPLGLLRILDVLLVTYLVYRLIRQIRGSRAWRVVTGIVIFLIALMLSDMLGLHTLHWVLDKMTLLGPVALVILFLPELRQWIEGFARIGTLGERLITPDTGSASIVDAIVEAADQMVKEETGGLIVIERGTPLEDIVRSGVALHALVSGPLLQTIFYEGNPLHDGAVIIRGNQVLAAACQLPLSDSPLIQSQFHMRHRAAVGITEQTDAIAVVVSEERGAISVAHSGHLRSLANSEELGHFLRKELSKPERKRRSARKNPPAEVVE